MERNALALANKMRAWELDAGESFTDYYMDGRVKPVSWVFWLLGKGFTEKANMLIDKIQAGERYIDQTEMFHINFNDEMDWWKEPTEDLYFADFMIWAEFLIASDRYWKDISEWFEEKEKENDEV